MTAINAVVLKSALPDFSINAVNANTVSFLPKNTYSKTWPTTNDNPIKQKAITLAMRFFVSVPIYLLCLTLRGDAVVECLGVDVALGGVVVLGGEDVLGFDTVGVGSLYSAVEREAPHTIHSASVSSL